MPRNSESGFNPFIAPDGQRTYTSITGEFQEIALSQELGLYIVRLNELPLIKTGEDTLTITEGNTTFLEVSSSVTPGPEEYRVDRDRGTGLVQFHVDDVGRVVSIDYEGGGSMINISNIRNANNPQILDLTTKFGYPRGHDAIGGGKSAIGYGAGRFLIGTGDSSYISSDDGGGTWTDRGTISGSNGISKFVYGDNLWVAIVSPSPRLWISTDNALAWSQPTTSGLNVGFGFSVIEFLGGQWLGTGSSAGTWELYTSPDLITWTQRTITITTNSLSSIAYNGTDLYLVGGNNNTLMSSPDGITWTTRDPSIGASDIVSIAHNQSDTWVMVFNFIKGIKNSSDGITWNNSDFNGQDVSFFLFQDITYEPFRNKFITLNAGGGSDNHVVTSSDGIKFGVEFVTEEDLGRFATNNQGNIVTTGNATQVMNLLSGKP